MRKLSKKLPPIPVAPTFNVRQSIVDGAGKNKPQKQGVQVESGDNCAAQKSNNFLDDIDVLAVSAHPPGAGAQSTNECGEGAAAAASTAAYKTH